MAIKNLNVVVTLFENLIDGPNGNTFVNVFNRFGINRNSDNELNCYMAIFMSAFLFDDEDDDVCVVKRNVDYKVKVRIVHRESGDGIDVDKFTFRFDDEEAGFYELKRIVHVEDMPFRYGIGDCVTLVYILSDEDKDWELQSISSFSINR